MVKVIPAAPDHVEFVAAHLRQPDMDEVEAAVGEIPPIDVLRHSAAATPELWTLFADEPLCVFGTVPCGPLLTPVGSPWMLGTAKLTQHAGVLIRETQAYLANIRERHPILINYVDARNRTSIRYLRAAGFEFDTAEPWGAAGLPFHRFHMGLN